MDNNISSTHLQDRIVENSIAIWLHPIIDKFRIDYENSIASFRYVLNSIKKFTDSDECIDFLTDITHEKVFMIISGDFSHLIVLFIQEIHQLDSIYILSKNDFKGEAWKNEYQKVKGIFDGVQHICNILSQDIQRSNRDLTPISILTPSSTIELNDLDQTFMYTQLIKETILEMKHDETAKKQFIDFCRVQYNGNKAQLRIIDEFDKEYPQPSPVWWYTHECFIYSMLNKALRIQDIQVIFKVGFFMNDLHRQIQQIHMKKIDNHHQFVVYRGQGILNEDFEKMKKNQGGLLSFNSFFSTSSDELFPLDIARASADNPELKGVIFEMEIAPNVATTPFASLHAISYIPDENEILFSMHAVFRIGKIHEVEDRVWKVNLILTNDDDDKELKLVMEHIRTSTENSTGWERLGHLMIIMGEFDKAEEIFNSP